MGPTLNAIGGSMNLSLQPLTRIHLHSDFQGDISAMSEIAYIYLFSGIASVVLLIACFNFINLGFSKEQVVVLPRMNDNMRQSYSFIQNELNLIFFNFLKKIMQLFLCFYCLIYWNVKMDEEANK